MKISRTYFKQLLVGLVCSILLICCKDKNDFGSKSTNDKKETRKERLACPVIPPSIGHSISTRFSPPQGFIREELDKESFASYLRSFPLLGSKEPVYLYNGNLKGNQSTHEAILDIDVGDRDLQQCADAVMRLRAEYLWNQKQYDEIAFNFTNGWKFEYEKWREGNDLVVNGNTTSWKPGSSPKESYQDFRKYLDWVFMYAGTLSLSKELKPKKIEDVEIGDVFIYGGSPGHAVVVVDLAVNETSGDKAFILAQSYMPAQQIHVLKNDENKDESPWYFLSEVGAQLNTPEWTFQRDALMSFGGTDHI